MYTEMSKKLFALTLAGALVACGGGDADPDAGADLDDDDPATPAAQIDPSTVGTISGTVNFAGTPPEMAPIDMSQEGDCAAAYSGSGPTEQTVIANNGKLANVFVYVSEGLSGAAPPPSGQPVLDQENCRYQPHVMGVRAGQQIRITNSDNLLHNINANPEVNRGFNISQPRAGIESNQTFQRPEVMIPVRCDVHGWMSAYIGVLDHPYFAVSGTDGNFRIPNLPPGDYTLEAWHELYGTQTASVSVTAQGSAEVTFEYSDDMAGRPVPLGEPLVIRHGHGAHAGGQ